MDREGFERMMFLLDSFQAVMEEGFKEMRETYSDMKEKLLVFDRKETEEETKVMKEISAAEKIEEVRVSEVTKKNKLTRKIKRERKHPRSQPEKDVRHGQQRRLRKNERCDRSKRKKCQAHQRSGKKNLHAQCRPVKCRYRAHGRLEKKYRCVKGRSERKQWRVLGKIEKGTMRCLQRRKKYECRRGVIRVRNRRRRPLRRGRQQSSQAKGGNSGTSHSQGPTGQQLLQSLASSASMDRSNAHEPTSSLQSTANPYPESRSSLQGPGSDSQIDIGSSMSQVLRSPALNGLLTGLSGETGAGSSDVLRNMLQQLTQSPQMRNTVNQIAQQVDTRDIEHIFFGSGRGQGGGIDLSMMLQPMMPIVSQVLGGWPRQPSSSNVEGEPMQLPSSNVDREPRSGSGVETSNDQNVQIDSQDLARRITSTNSPRDVFRAVVQSSARLSGSSCEDITSELCSDGRFAKEYVEMLSSDVNQRLQGNSDAEK